MAAYKSNRRLRKRGGLKAIFLAAALFVAPAALDTANPVTQPPSYEYQPSPAYTQEFEQIASTRQDWSKCSAEIGANQASIDTTLIDGLSRNTSVLGGDLGAYIQQEGIEFCPVTNQKYANKIDYAQNRISFFDHGDEAANTLHKLALTVEHKLGAYTEGEEFKRWDYQSQLVFRLAVKAKSRIYAGMFAASETEQGNTAYEPYLEKYFSAWKFDLQDSQDKRDQQIKTYTKKLLSDPFFYDNHAPYILTDIFDTLITYQTPRISSATNNSLWQTANGAQALKSIGLSSRDVTSMFEMQTLFKHYKDQAEYLDQKRMVPFTPLYIGVNRYANVPITDLTYMYERSGYILTLPQLLERGRNGFRNDNHAALADDKLNAIQADFLLDQVDPENHHLWHNIQRLNRHQTVIGQLLHNHAIKHNVFFAENETQNRTGGTWTSSEKMVRVKPHDDPRYDHGYASGTVAHELLHAVQDNRGVLEYSNKWSIQEYQMHVMSYEAAAFIVARLMAFELQMNGYDTEPWDSVKNSKLSRVIEEEYNKHIQGDKNHMTSLELAGSKAWQALYENQYWLDSYNKWVAHIYTKRLLGGYLETDRVEEFSIDNARNDGYISRLFNATAHVSHLPDKDSLFGSNETMRHLHEFLEMEFLKRTHGDDASDYLAYKSEIIEKGNPFVRMVKLDEIDIDNVTDEELYNLILCQANVSECKRPERPKTAPLFS